MAEPIMEPQVVNTSTTDEETQTRTVRAEVYTGPIAYGRHGRYRWQPRRASAQWERSRVTGAPWGPWRQTGAQWSGVTIRGDGSEGADRRERFWAVSPGNGPAEQAVAEWIISVTPSDEEE